MVQLLYLCAIKPATRACPHIMEREVKGACVCVSAWGSKMHAMKTWCSVVSLRAVARRLKLLRRQAVCFASGGDWAGVAALQGVHLAAWAIPTAAQHTSSNPARGPAESGRGTDIDGTACQQL